MKKNWLTLSAIVLIFSFGLANQKKDRAKIAVASGDEWDPEPYETKKDNRFWENSTFSLVLSLNAFAASSVFILAQIVYGRWSWNNIYGLTPHFESIALILLICGFLQLYISYSTAVENGFVYRLFNQKKAKTNQKNASKWQQKVECAVPILLALSAMVIVCYFYSYYYQQGLTTVYGDGIAKLVNARNVFDNPLHKFSIAQIGQQWLPGMQMLMLLTIWIKPMYTSGLSGSIWSILFFVITVLSVYQITRMLTGSIIGGIAASVCILFNLNLIYFGISPMAEELIIASLAICTLCLMKLEDQPNSNKWLLLSSLALGWSMGVRYEFWFITVVVALPVMTIVFWRHNIRGWNFVGKIVRLFSISGFLVFLWVVVWEWKIGGDPLAFAFSKYSAHAIDVVGANKTYAIHNLGITLREYGTAISWNFPQLTITVAIAGALLFAIKWIINRERRIAPVYLLGMPIFYVVSIFNGQNAIDTRFGLENSFNIRYGVTIAVLVAVGVGYLAGNISSLKFKWALPLGKGLAFMTIGGTILVASFSWVNPNNIAALGDVGAHPNQNGRVLSTYLQKHYSGGSILIESFGQVPILWDSQLSLTDFISESSPGLWKKALGNPQNQVSVVVVGQRPDDTVGQMVNSDPTFAQYFTKVFENKAGTIYFANFLASNIQGSTK